MHIPVLTRESIDGLRITATSVVVDCTVGSGGHTAAILERLGSSGTYLGIDVDPAAIAGAERIAANASAAIHLVCGNFRDIATIVARERIPTPTAILADLGWRMDQFNAPAGSGKGFSFAADEPLLMTYGDPAAYDFTAYDIANTWDETSIADIVYGYGEERAARRIAAAIVAARAQGSIETSRQLATIVEQAIPQRFRRSSKIHPATKTFQAFRIAVNDELGALNALLTDGFDALAVGGRMAIISFHSLEDRLVKRTFTTYARDQRALRITKKPTTASPDELQTNPRARSAKLRIIEKTAP